MMGVSAADYRRAIAAALDDGNLAAVVALIRRMSGDFPAEAGQVLDTINVGLAIRQESTDLNSAE